MTKTVNEQKLFTFISSCNTVTDINEDVVAIEEEVLHTKEDVLAEEKEIEVNRCSLLWGHGFTYPGSSEQQW